MADAIATPTYIGNRIKRNAMPNGRINIGNMRKICRFSGYFPEQMAVLQDGGTVLLRSPLRADEERKDRSFFFRQSARVRRHGGEAAFHLCNRFFLQGYRRKNTL
jgi:hypothetical protein